MSFANPPIKEAIFDIRTRLAEGIKLQDLASFKEKIKDDFLTEPEFRINLKGQLAIEPGSLPESIPLVSTKDGYLFKDANDQKVVQARLDGFSFSQIDTYKDWEDFYGAAYKLWKFYIEIAHPEKAIRVALRYVNRIELPFEGTLPLKLEDYFNTGMELPDNLSVGIIESLTRTVVTSKDFEPSLAIITQVVQPAEEKNNGYILPFIFDIDVFQEVSLDPIQDEATIRDIFKNNLRTFKNDIFFKSITEKTEGLFR